MRYLCCLLWCVVFLGLSLEKAGAQESYVNWPIEEVIVYESGARITRSGMVRLSDQGRANYVIGDLSKSVDENMVQVLLDEGWALVSSKHRESTRQGLESEVDNALKDLEVDLMSNRQTLAMRNALHEAYSEELTMIQANRKVSGNELLLVEDLQEHADFWRQRVKELKYLMLELMLEIEDLQRDREEIKRSEEEWKNQRRQKEGQFVLQLSGPPNASASVALIYLATDATWSPVYDAGVESDGSIAMKRFATVSQLTQRDWDAVPMTLTVGRPSQSLAPPVMSPQNLSIARSQSTNAYEWTPEMETSDDEPQLKMMQDKASAVASMRQTNALDRYDFIPENLATVSGTGKSERIYIDDFMLRGSLTYLALPALSDEAYQIALTSAWTEQRLLPGVVNIHTNGMHRGAFHLDLPAPGDTLRLPLGQDTRVRCSRKRLVDLCSSNVFGGSRKTTQSFELVIENQHNRAIEVVIEDRIPVTNSSDIQVEVVELDGGQLEAVSGIVTWNQTLAPMESKTLILTYTVSFPKGHSLLGL